MTVAPLPTPFRYLWAATVVNHAGSFVILFLVPYLTLERGLSPADCTSRP